MLSLARLQALASIGSSQICWREVGVSGSPVVRLQFIFPCAVDRALSGKFNDGGVDVCVSLLLQGALACFEPRLAVACLTRYEAWAAGPVLALAYILRKDRSLVGWLRAAFLFGWMPALWILVNGGLASRAHFVVESSSSISRLLRYVHLGWVTVKYTQFPVLVLAAVGVWRICKDRSLIDWRLWVQVAFCRTLLDRDSVLRSWSTAKPGALRHCP